MDKEQHSRMAENAPEAQFIVSDTVADWSKNKLELKKKNSPEK